MRNSIPKTAGFLLQCKRECMREKWHPEFSRIRRRINHKGHEEMRGARRPYELAMSFRDGTWGGRRFSPVAEPPPVVVLGGLAEPPVAVHPLELDRAPAQRDFRERI